MFSLLLSKIYISVINKKINDWANDNNKITEDQPGFRAKIDNVFILYASVDKHISKRKGSMYVLIKTNKQTTNKGKVMS